MAAAAASSRRNSQAKKRPNARPSGSRPTLSMQRFSPPLRAKATGRRTSVACSAAWRISSGGHPGVETRPVPPLEAFRFEFDEEAALAKLKEQAKEEAAAAAAATAASHRSSREAQEEARQRRVAHAIAHPPARLEGLHKRLWAAFCEAQSQESEDGAKKKLGVSGEGLGRHGLELL